jgi:hypothetical protein
MNWHIYRLKIDELIAKTRETLHLRVQQTTNNSTHSNSRQHNICCLYVFIYVFQICCNSVHLSLSICVMSFYISGAEGNVSFWRVFYRSKTMHATYNQNVTLKKPTSLPTAYLKTRYVSQTDQNNFATNTFLTFGISHRYWKIFLR